jgi:hypothetical protein
MEELINYGVLGIWTLFNINTILYYRKREHEHESNLLTVISNNTVAMSKVYEVVKGCRK